MGGTQLVYYGHLWHACMHILQFSFKETVPMYSFYKLMTSYIFCFASLFRNSKSKKSATEIIPNPCYYTTEFSQDLSKAIEKWKAVFSECSHSSRTLVIGKKLGEGTCIKYTWTITGM